MASKSVSSVCRTAEPHVAGRRVAGRRQRVAGHGRAVAGVRLARGRYRAARRHAPAARPRRVALRRAGHSPSLTHTRTYDTLIDALGCPRIRGVKRMPARFYTYKTALPRATGPMSVQRRRV